MNTHNTICRTEALRGRRVMTRSGLSAAFYREGVPVHAVREASLALQAAGYLSNVDAECGLLPKRMASQAQAVFAEIGQNSAIKPAAGVNPEAGVFVENFVWDLHGIVPLACEHERTPLQQVHPLAPRVYECVAHAYIAAVSGQ